MPNGNDRPWDKPWKQPDYDQPLKLKVSVLDYNTANEPHTLHEITIDYSNMFDRKMLGRITFWACNHGYAVETAAE